MPIGHSIPLFSLHMLMWGWQQVTVTYYNTHFRTECLSIERFSSKFNTDLFFSNCSLTIKVKKKKTNHYSISAVFTLWGWWGHWWASGAPVCVRTLLMAVNDLRKANAQVKANRQWCTVNLSLCLCCCQLLRRISYLLLEEKILENISESVQVKSWKLYKDLLSLRHLKWGQMLFMKTKCVLVPQYLVLIIIPVHCLCKSWPC